jgi:hypothetical protein
VPVFKATCISVAYRQHVSDDVEVIFSERVHGLNCSRFQ